MPRVNLSISQELYDQLQKEAEKGNITVNHLILSVLEEKYGEANKIDYVVLLDKMIAESKQMTGDFVLADLPTYAGIDNILVEIEANVSAPSVKARLGKMYNEAVRKQAIPDVDRAVIEKNGTQELKFLSRAAVYTKMLKKIQEEKK